MPYLRWNEDDKVFAKGANSDTGEIVSIHYSSSIKDGRDGPSRYFDLTTEGIWVSRRHLRDKDIRKYFLFLSVSANSAAEKMIELLGAKD